MKILFFIESLHSGGKERRLVELIKGLSNFPEIMMEFVLTKKGIHYKDIDAIDIKIHYLIRDRGIKKDPRLFNQFYQIAKEFKPDIIHVWSNLTAIYALPSKVFLKVPLINNQITNATPQKSGSILSHKLTFPFSDKIIANTYAGIKAYEAPKSKSLVIYNGFDFERVSNLDEEDYIRDQFKIKTKYVVGMVANFTDKKDYHTYIEAANIILESRKDITFLCIGSGKSEVYKQMVTEDNKKNILFLGKQDHVESIMNICDIGVLLASRNHKEGISNAILEFHALGKPVIASLGGGTSEIIENNTNGYLINQESPKELEVKMLWLLNNPEKRFEFGENAKSLVKDKFGIKRMIDEFMTVYNEILS